MSNMGHSNTLPFRSEPKETMKEQPVTSSRDYLSRSEKPCTTSAHENLQYVEVSFKSSWLWLFWALRPMVSACFRDSPFVRTSHMIIWISQIITHFLTQTRQCHCGQPAKTIFCGSRVGLVNPTVIDSILSEHLQQNHPNTWWKLPYEGILHFQTHPNAPKDGIALQHTSIT